MDERKNFLKKMGPPEKDPSTVDPDYLKYKLRGYSYYRQNMEKVKKSMSDRRLAFNKALPPLNLICQYCNKPFVLPGMNENKHKQHIVMYCSSICAERTKRLKKLWVPKWLYNFYLDKKLYYIKESFRRRKHWTLKLLLKSDKSQNLKIKKFLRKYWWWNEDNRKFDEYNVIKKYYTYCIGFILFFRIHRCIECSKPFIIFISTPTSKTYNYKNTIAQRLRKYRNMKLYGKNRVPPEKYTNRGRKVHCSSECGSVWYKKPPPRPLFSRLIGKGYYIAFKRDGLKKMIFTKKRFKKIPGIKMRMRIRFRLWHYYITSPFVRFHRFLFFKCYWCRVRLHGPFTQRFCSDTHQTRYKKYVNRWPPLWFYRHFYTRYDLYKIRWRYYPRIKNIIKEFVRSIIKFLKKKLKKSKKPYYIKKERWLTCKHCQKEFVWEETIKLHAYLSPKSYVKNFCSADCRILFKEAIVQRLKERNKERNLAAWGTEERPDEETRKNLQRKKNAERHRYKMKTDPGYKLIKIMRTRTKKIMKKYRIEGSSAFYAPLDMLKILGVKDGDELRAHMEDQFVDGMTWSNHGTGLGKWVCDHHIPIKYWRDNFDLVNSFNIQRKCFGKENLKPMWWLDNAHKSAKLNYEPKC